MHLIQILLPLLPGASGSADERFAGLKAELTEKFGGVTVFQQSLAEGLWNDGGKVVRDAIVVFEVMAEALDREWWARFRARLERDFQQDVVVARSYQIELL